MIMFSKLNINISDSFINIFNINFSNVSDSINPIFNLSLILPKKRTENDGNVLTFPQFCTGRCLRFN